ncbi:MAG: hypothetical protein JRJ45_01360 [Deltaproteobacteria bacterium]|nr:hypothetical protein [Deltaproteobacteria bacterium]
MTPQRNLYWKIDGVWVFYALAALAISFLVVGVALHLSVWLKNAPKSRVSFFPGALKRTLPWHHALSHLMGVSHLAGWYSPS